jgi:hypothetical protein
LRPSASRGTPLDCVIVRGRRSSAAASSEGVGVRPIGAVLGARMRGIWPLWRVTARPAAVSWGCAVGVRPLAGASALSAGWFVGTRPLAGGLLPVGTRPVTGGLLPVCARG